MLEIFTLGKTELRIDGDVQSSRLGVRRTLMLAYLAEAKQPQPRAELASLLWPDAEDALAKTSLRSLVTRMRQQGLAPYLDATRDSIGLVRGAAIDYDVDRLRRHAPVPEDASASALQAAAACYGGRFFADEVLDAFPILSVWVDGINYELDILMIRVYYRLTTLLLAEQQAAAAVEAATRLMQFSPYDDRAQALYLRALIAADRPAQAKQALAAYQRMMAEEEPTATPAPELQVVAAELTQPGAAARTVSSVALRAAAAANVAANVAADTAGDAGAQPPQSGPAIIGRAAEAARLTYLLEQGARLISVIGLGGIGKTSFVRSQLPALRTRFPDGLHLADLRGEEQTGADAAAALFQAIAGALALTPQNGVPLEDQVQAALATAPVCLILDNFETLHDAALTVARLVDRTPTLTVITTSRQALYTKREALVELGGLRIAGGGGRISGGARGGVRGSRLE